MLKSRLTSNKRFSLLRALHSNKIIQPTNKNRPPTNTEMENTCHYLKLVKNCFCYTIKLSNNNKKKKNICMHAYIHTTVYTYNITHPSYIV